MISQALNTGTMQVQIADHGMSDEADALRRCFAAANTGDTRVGGRARFRESCLESLKAAVAEAQVLGWDGHDARPVNGNAFTQAVRFLEYLPPETPLPEIGVDPDGDIAVDWSPGVGRVVSLRISGDGTIYYAGLDHEARFHGSELLREGVPRAVWQAIERVVSGAWIRAGE